MREKECYMVPAVEKAIAILEYIANGDGCSFKSIHIDLKLPKSTIFSILNTLTHYGYIKKSEGGLFYPTLKMFSMGIKARANAHSSRAYLPPLEELRDKTGFTVFFCVYENGEQVIMDKLSGFSTMVEFKAYVGERKKLHSSSAGKAMAAFISETELERVLSKGFDRFTNDTITTREDFLRHLETVRQNGYALDDGEGEAGVRCIGVPILIQNGLLYGSISIATLKDNLDFSDEARYARFVGLLKETARRVAQVMGG